MGWVVVHLPLRSGWRAQAVELQFQQLTGGNWAGKPPFSSMGLCTSLVLQGGFLMFLKKLHWQLSPVLEMVSSHATTLSVFISPWSCPEAG